MQVPISDCAAKAFSEAFYRRLVAEDPVDLAINEGRMAIAASRGGSCEWATPVLLSALVDGRLFEIVVPPAERDFRKGREALLSGDLWEARRTLSRVLTADDCHAGARALRCLIELIEHTPGLLTLPEADRLDTVLLPDVDGDVPEAG